MATSLPLCPLCHQRLGTHGLPATLPCGHNGCVECLRNEQRRGSARCPVCLCSFGEELPIAPNTELRDLIALATTLFMDDKEREDGWEAFPNKALTAEQYANDLQLERAAAQPPPFSRPSPYSYPHRTPHAQQPSQQHGHSLYPPAYLQPHFSGHYSRDAAQHARGAVPVPAAMGGAFCAPRHHHSVPSSLAGRSPPYGSSPADARMPMCPGSYGPLESFMPFACRTDHGSDFGGYGDDVGGEGGCSEAYSNSNHVEGADSPLSSSPTSFSSNAIMLAHHQGQGLTSYAGGGNSLAPTAAAAAATAAAMRQLMELLPPQWLPDSMASACGGCHKPFRPLVRLRHHCRCCGRIFCQACSSTYVLLPPKFNTREPQRTCDMCASMLSSLQPYLASTQTTAAQPPVLDALDAVSLRTWVNAPYCSTLEGDVFKAANVLSKFTKAARLQPEAGLPTALLAGAKGLVVMSLIKLGAGWSATFGTGVVVSRAADGTWSAPCSVAAYGLGWGFQVGGELTDLLLVLRTDDAVRAFNGAVHVGLGGNVSVAAGPLGRHADATLMSGTASAPGIPAAAYSYSCSQGAFVGISVEGTLLTVRSSVNRAFYGLPVTANDLLVQPWAMAPPPAAATLYEALADMTRKYENRRRYIHAAPSPPSASSASTPLPALNGVPANTTIISAADSADLMPDTGSLPPQHPHAAAHTACNPDLSRHTPPPSSSQGAGASSSSGASSTCVDGSGVQGGQKHPLGLLLADGMAVPSPCTHALGSLQEAGPPPHAAPGPRGTPEQPADSGVVPVLVPAASVVELGGAGHPSPHAPEARSGAGGDAGDGTAVGGGATGADTATSSGGTGAVPAHAPGPCARHSSSGGGSQPPAGAGAAGGSSSGVGLARLCSSPAAQPAGVLVGGGEHLLLAALHASSPSPPCDPMDGWCFDGVAGALEGCFEEEEGGSNSGGNSAGSGMAAASSNHATAAQPCGEIAKAAAAAVASRSQAPPAPATQGKEQPSNSGDGQALPDTHLADALLGAEQPASTTTTTTSRQEGAQGEDARPQEQPPPSLQQQQQQQRQQQPSKPAREAAGATAEGECGREGKERGRAGGGDGAGAPHSHSADPKEYSDAEGPAGAASEAIVGSLDSDTSGLEGALSASSACGSAPRATPGPLVGSAPTGGGSVGPMPARKAQVSSKSSKKGKKKR